MAVLAAPPDLFLCAGHHVQRRERAVFLRVPLLCKRRVCRSKIVFSRRKPSSRADRAAAACHARPDSRAPAVPLFAPPPDWSLASGADIGRDKRQVLLLIPLPGKRRIHRCKIVVTGHHLSSRTIRAAGACASGIDRSRPGMPVFAAPPYTGMTSVGDRLRRQRQIARRIPFVQKLLLLVSAAKIIQALPHMSAGAPIFSLLHPTCVHIHAAVICLSPLLLVHNFSYVVKHRSEIHNIEKSSAFLYLDALRCMQNHRPMKTYIHWLFRHAYSCYVTSVSGKQFPKIMF